VGCRVLTVDGVVALWLDSPPHNEIIHGPHYQHIGCGWSRAASGDWVVCEFASPR
jgi:uncharacterized protein YkwD